MGLLDIIFPTVCLACGREGNYICNSCLKEVRKANLFCLECHKAAIDGATHTKCRKKYSIDFAYSPWEYSAVIRKAILKLKYNFAYKITEELADRFVEKIDNGVSILPKDAVLVPIPLYKSRKNWRGFNQSEELGKIIACELNWKYDCNLLIRTKNTSPQAELKGKQRSKNLTGAFSLSKKGRLRNSTIVLFDDVLTTGSTLREACKIFKRNGAKVVWGLTIAA